MKCKSIFIDYAKCCTNSYHNGVRWKALKFNDPRVKERIREFFGESEYERWLVVSPQKVDSQLVKIARNKFGFEIKYIDTILRMIMRKLRFGSRDQVLRILEIVKLKEDFDRTHFVPPVKKPRL